MPSRGAEPKNGVLSDSVSSSTAESDAQSSQCDEQGVKGTGPTPTTPELKHYVDSQRPSQRSRRPFDGSELAMAGASSRSTLFHLQVDELLAEIRPNHEKSKSKFEGTLRKLKEAIECIPNRAPLPVSHNAGELRKLEIDTARSQVLEAEKTLRRNAKIAVPFPEPHPGKEAKYSLEYAKPSNINVVGSFALKTGVKLKASRVIDLAVTMPKVRHGFLLLNQYRLTVLGTVPREGLYQPQILS